MEQSNLPKMFGKERQKMRMAILGLLFLSACDGKDPLIIDRWGGQCVATCKKLGYIGAIPFKTECFCDNRWIKLNEAKMPR